ncbi:PD-(D/E)XK nuclease family protein [Egicoccus sp. AB-alg2]|uniref:PD-(D/E)XK nuclease family protein n=1 Tax=Egicoccus sp. AB-alg2 TaxID=3242693 RepID=UPI00359DD12F
MSKDTVATAALATGALALDLPARRRLAEDLLGWGLPRPADDPALVGDLRARLEAGLAEVDGALSEAASAARGGRLLVTKSALERLACDGWQRDPKPYAHSWANARGTLTHLAVEQDWHEARADTPAAVVGRVWQAEASRRPGDPASLSRWLNDLPAADAQCLRDEVTGLLVGFREVWPPLPPGSVQAHVERPVEVRLAGGRVVLRGVPDLVLVSPRRDDRARTLVVDLKTGRPRAQHDRHELRFYALLVALAAGRLPFRWATFYVTEGRAEVESLRAETLLVTVRRVLDGVAQLVRLADAPEEDLRLRGGAWCHYCAREDTCETAAEARRQQALSQPSGMLGP